MSWWKCAACGGGGDAEAAGSATAAAAARPLETHLLLKEIPSSAMAPLFFFWCVLPHYYLHRHSWTGHLDFLFVLAPHGVLRELPRARGRGEGGGRRATLQALRRPHGAGPDAPRAARDPGIQSIVPVVCGWDLQNRVPFSIAAIATLRERILQCEAQLKSAKQQHHNDSEAAEPGPSLSSQQAPASESTLQRKRKRVMEATPPDSQVSPPPSFRLVNTLPSQPSVSSLQSAQASSAFIASLEAESKALQRQLHELVRQWEQFANETAAEQSLPLHHHLQQSFSSTHLNILKVMYDNATGKLEVAALTRQIELFLLHQSTLLKMKYDLLAAVETCREIEQLRAPVFQTSETPSKVTNLIINSTKEQLSHRYKAFQALSRPYLSLIGAANKHLFALYTAAQSLQSMRETSEQEREAAVIQRELFGSGSSSKERVDHTRSRRRCGYGAKSSSSSSNNDITSAAISDPRHPRHLMAGGGYDDVSRVQETLEFGNRITEISKKVELWRALSSTIATTCVLSVSELSLANVAPLS